MHLFDLKCKSCGSSIVPDPQDLANGSITCQYCRAVFTLIPPKGHEVPPLRPKVAMPKGISVDLGDGLEIRRKWLSPVTYFFAFFALVWNGFLVFWNYTAFSQGLLQMAAFSIVHVIVGVGLAYKVVSDFLNTTVITVRLDGISVRSGPLPWPGNKDIAPGTLSQVYCKRKVHNGSKGSSSTSYSVLYVDREGRAQNLVKGLLYPEQALYIEQEIETYLGIRDQRIEGAYTG